MSREKAEKVNVSFRLTEEESEKLKQCAAACGISVAEFMRQLCRGNAPQPQPPREFWELLTLFTRYTPPFKRVSLTIPPPQKPVKRLRILYWNYSRHLPLRSVLMWQN